jgi:hypothetical protein
MLEFLVILSLGSVSADIRDGTGRHKHSNVAQRALTTEELEILLSDSTLTLSSSRGIQSSHPETEIFRNGGYYEYRHGRAPHLGRFTIANGLVCTRFDESTERSCYRIYRDVEGRLWKGGPEGRRTEVEIHRMTQRP